jgi:hypothetical protein
VYRTALALALLCAGARAAAAQERDSGLEEIAAVDPYTRGEPAAFERAGYVGLGPFTLIGATGTDEVQRTLGEARVLWVETAHFKLGSTLAGYRTGADKREEKQLRAELERLAKKFERFAPPRNRLDPWLRLHLFAQRLEEQYAEFMRRFGFEDRDFVRAEPESPFERSTMGSGPFLGMPEKPTVLLTEGDATLGRFLGHYLRLEESGSWRGQLKGASMFLGLSAERLRSQGYALDAGLHCALSANLAYNLVEGFRGYHDSSPEWFKCGLAHWFSRRIDERWTVYARGTTLELEDDSWRWAPRVRGLVAHEQALPWEKMLEWKRWEDIDAAGHMLVWSRFDWLLARKSADLRAFLMGMTEPVIPAAQQELCLRAAFGASAAELDAQWRESALRSAPGK